MKSEMTGLLTGCVMFFLCKIQWSADIWCFCLCRKCCWLTGLIRICLILRGRLWLMATLLMVQVSQTCLPVSVPLHALRVHDCVGFVCCHVYCSSWHVPGLYLFRKIINFDMVCKIKITHCSLHTYDTSLAIGTHCRWLSGSLISAVWLASDCLYWYC